MLSLNPNVWEEKVKAGRAHDCHLAGSHLGEQQWQDGFGAPGKGFHAGAVGVKLQGQGVSRHSGGCSPLCLQARLRSGQQ